MAWDLSERAVHPNVRVKFNDRLDRIEQHWTGCRGLAYVAAGTAKVMRWLRSVTLAICG